MAEELLGEESGEFLRALDKDAVTSVRLNRRKPGAEFAHSEPVPWCSSGLYLAARPEFIYDPMLHAGAYYVQDASSMIYESAMEKIVEEFRNESTIGGISILDMCAAPGGKTTAMINALPDGSHVTANEYSAKRASILRENLTKWGYPHITVTNRDSAFYGRHGESFDVVAVDAPCSGEGMMRKDEFARQQWSLDLTRQCSRLQKEILANAEKALKPGGFLMYSTCTFNRWENEENAEYIIKELGLEPYNPGFPEEWGIPGGIDTELPVYRFMPHKTKGEGLFLAMFRKPGDRQPTAPKKRVPGRIKTTDKNVAPEIEEILSSEFNARELPRVEIDKATALSYLRREAIRLDAEAPKGYVVVTYKGHPLGLVKNIGSRANNLYPKNWRILK